MERAWDERIGALAALFPLSEQAAGDQDRAIAMLSDTAYRFGWVLTEFDWSAWAHGPECQRLIQHPEEVQNVDRHTLAKLLTAHLRQDRFCEGHLSSAYEAGHLAAIVQRAVALTVEGGRPDGAASSRVDGSMSRSARRMFNRYIGIDYSGAETPSSSLSGLRVYMASQESAPTEVPPPPGSKKYWTRRGIAEWLVQRLGESEPTLVGIDHGFSFPLKYFERHALPRNWPAFLDDFHHHWPTDDENTYVEFVRDGTAGNGAVRDGDAKWRRVTEVRAGAAKSVFHFDVQGSVAKSTHAGLPWLRYIRQRLPGRVHFWPFDGWAPCPGRSVIAEVYPSLWSRGFPKGDRTPDRHDAWSVAEWMRRADLDGGLVQFFAPNLSEADRTAAAVEGWILGLS